MHSINFPRLMKHFIDFIIFISLFLFSVSFVLFFLGVKQILTKFEPSFYNVAADFGVQISKVLLTLQGKGHKLQWLTSRDKDCPIVSPLFLQTCECMDEFSLKHFHAERHLFLCLLAQNPKNKPHNNAQFDIPFELEWCILLVVADQGSFYFCDITY